LLITRILQSCVKSELTFLMPSFPEPITITRFPFRWRSTINTQAHRGWYL